MQKPQPSKSRPAADAEGGGGSLGPGLYLVSVPIGNARDITLRALDVLRDADALAAEDTRSLRRLMEIHGVPLGGRKIVAYHDRNGAKARPGLLAALGTGRTLAYASEAGTPLVADPGFALARAAIAEGHNVTAVPGVTAAVAALTVSGLPSDRFTFAGFPPATKAARRTWYDGLGPGGGTLILYESPRRLGASLRDAADVLGPRPAAVCRELTKRFEEVRRGTLETLAEDYASAEVKGEVVLLIGAGAPAVPAEETVEAALGAALRTMTVKDAAAAVAAAHGLKRRDVYQKALELVKR